MNFLRSKLLCLFIVLIVLPLLLISCLGSGKGITRFDRLSNTPIKEADRYFEEKKFKTAALKYSAYVYSPYPEKKELSYARYRLGLCQHNLKQYHEAYETLGVLLLDNPDYVMADEAMEIMAKCKIHIDSRRRDIAENLENLRREIEKAEKNIERDSENAENHFQLANLYWDAGRFRDAVAEYEIAASLNPDYFDDNNLRNRVRITSNGRFTVRDPLLEIGQQATVRVVGAKLERVERQDWLGQYELLRLSGAVENTGLRDVRNVRVEVSIYDFYNTVQDTQTVRIDMIPAGGKRNFAVMLTQYRGLGIDIKKFTTQVFYEE